MGPRQPPPAEVAVDTGLVRRLLHAQAPWLAEERLELVGEGWDNVVVRIGLDLVARLPRRLSAVPLLENEQTWLPALAPRLPLPVPVPTVQGRPAVGYPWPWSVVPWFPGRSALWVDDLDWDVVVAQLVDFLTALHVPAPADAPRNPVRGVPLRDRDALTTPWLGQLDDLVPAPTASVWQALVEVPPWPGPALWLHGDLHPDNLVTSGGRVAAVVDWGDLTAGDPATDLTVAWLLLPPGPRTDLREALAVDDDTWLRGAGWGLSLAVAMLAHGVGRARYVEVAGTTLDQVVAEIGGW